MAFIIAKLIGENHFSLNILNSRIKYFTYYDHEKNVPPGIRKEHLQNGCIIISASEMLCLTKNFIFLVGNLIPEGNEIWSLPLLTLEILQLSLNQTFTTASLQLLRNLIEEHHVLYLKLSRGNLKPKYHFLLHYSSTILKMGPPVFLSSMRFEAKHKQLKAVAQSIQCRKNLPLSLTLRNQMKLCHRFLSLKGIPDRINFEIIHDLSVLTNSLFEDHNLDSNDFFQISWYEINGIKYNVKNVLWLEYDELLPVFCQIK